MSRGRAARARPTPGRRQDKSQNIQQRPRLISSPVCPAEEAELKGSALGVERLPAGSVCEGTPSLGGLCSRPLTSQPLLALRAEAPAPAPPWGRGSTVYLPPPRPEEGAHRAPVQGVSGISSLYQEIFLGIYIPEVKSLLKTFLLCAGVGTALQNRPGGRGVFSWHGGPPSSSPQGLTRAPVTLLLEMWPAMPGWGSLGLSFIPLAAKPAAPAWPDASRASKETPSSPGALYLPPLCPLVPFKARPLSSGGRPQGGLV